MNHISSMIITNLTKKVHRVLPSYFGLQEATVKSWAKSLRSKSGKNKRLWVLVRHCIRTSYSQISRKKFQAINTVFFLLFFLANKELEVRRSGAMPLFLYELLWRLFWDYYELVLKYGETWAKYVHAEITSFRCSPRCTVSVQLIKPSVLL